MYNAEVNRKASSLTGGAVLFCVENSQRYWGISSNTDSGADGSIPPPMAIAKVSTMGNSDSYTTRSKVHAPFPVLLVDKRKDIVNHEKNCNCSY